MMKQFVSSIVSRFIEVEPMNAYIQSMPEKVSYPCYLMNKVEVDTTFLNSYYYMNTVRVYTRVFHKNELELKEKVNNIMHDIMESRGKINIIEADGTSSNRFVRVEDIGAIEVTVDENDIYCMEISFSFQTTHNVSVTEFPLINSVELVTNYE